MCIHYKESGTFKEVAPYCNVNSTWEPAVEAWTKVSGDWKRTYLAEGVTSFSFISNMGSGFNDSVTSIAVQSDGKILVGGEYSSFNGNNVAHFVRLNADGTEDTAFSTNLGTGFDGFAVNSIAVQADGKILAGGRYTGFNGNTRYRLVRLNSDGTEDTAFYTNLGAGFRAGGFFDSFANVYSIAVQADGKILAGGYFTLLNGNTRRALVRLNSDGTEDTAFYTNLGAGFPTGGTPAVRSIAVQSDGKILVGGTFLEFNNNNIQGFVRLNADGTEDTAFSTNLGTGFNNAVYSVALQSDGKILVGGNFTQLDGNTNYYLVRLNADGTEDTAFGINLGTGFGDIVNSIAVQSDGKILVGGFFTYFNGNTRNRLVRLNSDGTEDTAFYTNLGAGFSTSVRSIAVQSDGLLLVGGTFTSYNGIDVFRFALLGACLRI